MKRRTEISAELKDDASVLRNKNFNFLWSAQILSQIAQNLLNFALIIRVFQLAQGTRLANVSVALLILSFGIPSIFFAAAAGVYVDHWNKKLVLVISNVLRATLVLGYLAFEHNLFMVLLLSFLISTTTQFFTPAEAASMPALVGKRQLLRANSLFVFTLYASFIIGYSLSAPVIAAFGAKGPYIVTSIMFGAAAIFVSLLPNIQIKGTGKLPFKQVVRYTLREISNNWQLIRSNHNLSFPILQLTITQAMLGVVLALAPALSLVILGVPLERSSHILVIPAGVGMVLGVTFIDRINKHVTRTRLIASGLVLGAVALVFLGLAHTLYDATRGGSLDATLRIGVIVAPLVFVLGFLMAIVSVASQTVLQENASEESRGKVFGALGMMINIAATLPIFLAATFADLFGVSAVITALGVGLLTFSVIQYVQLMRQRKLEH